MADKMTYPGYKFQAKLGEGAFGEIFSTSRGAFLASKLILGWGLGFYLTLGPLVCSEIAPVVLRGISTAGLNLGIAIGQLLSGCLSPFCRGDRLQDTLHWPDTLLIRALSYYYGSLLHCTCTVTTAPASAQQPCGETGGYSTVLPSTARSCGL